MSSDKNEQIDVPLGIHSNSRLTILIIGSTGNVGSAVLRAIQRSDRFQMAIRSNLLEIRASYHSRKSKESIEELYPSIKPVELDIDQIDVNARSKNPSIESAFAGVNCLFLQTGYFTKSIIQSKTILDYAKASHVEFILHGGVLAQDTTINESFAFHILIERYIESLGFKYCHLHPAVYMQVLIGYAGERIVDLTNKQVDLYWKPDYLLTWVDCNDVGMVAASILCDFQSHHGRVYSLSSDQLTMTQATAIFSEVFQCKLVYRYTEAEQWANSICEKILAGADMSWQEKFSRCHYIHAIKQAFLRHNNDTFDEKWQLYTDLNQLLTHYQWKSAGNTLKEFVHENKANFVDTSKIDLPNS